MTDLSAFNVSHFAYGRDNLQIVDSLPGADDGQSVDAEADDDNGGGLGLGSLATSVLQLFYPANSINPTSDIPGGADFYATPIDLSDANNVTLEYSVYFPPDFDWVQAGKLPGIYGGHTACSGGDAAISCFSTRLMWRSHGAGELYLYAPKDKQTDALCSAPPQSVCDADYGLSVGRGSFHFAAGNWTHVRQTVTLNTPGQQDGGFVLEVDGNVVMDRSDVFYRDLSISSTFFGGHESEYASPKDQYTWFANFAMSRNA
ncbi:polysaccharide lyase family 14 protein [Gelatoporia subvermispora B]|uniref:Polysaccharide lyase family 14 protein n=1 Tax=Ceriporiopsis subvermispora (strain B) TaxID=914234 RepID=M2PEL7_CERS8|nr:polysaccharide lyase family 14 protein [Gelatoporia subvermispora B]